MVWQTAATASVAPTTPARRASCASTLLIRLRFCSGNLLRLWQPLSSREFNSSSRVKRVCKTMPSKMSLMTSKSEIGLEGCNECINDLVINPGKSELGHYWWLSCQTLSWEPLLYITSDPMNVVRNNGPLSNTFFLRCTINDAKGGFGKSVEAIVNVDA